MSANQLFLVICLVATIGSLFLNIASIKWGLRWANIADMSFFKAFGLLVAFMLAQMIASIVVGLLLAVTHVNLPGVAEGFVSIGLQVVVPCLVVMLIYKTSAGRAVKSIIPLIVASLGVALLAILVIRPFVYEAFFIPTNAMAPTLLGNHLEAPCPSCGSPAFGSPPDPRQSESPDGVQMVCSKELKTVYVKNAHPTMDGGDRILVCKHITPKRWDLTVFRYPGDPTVNYVMRIVGLPGEKLEIRDGAVWINDEKVEPPESIRGIHYSPTIDTHGQEFSGPGSFPLTLGSDEYFVLGDFADASSDSRLWKEGAPGHPPYAVPASNIVGVVINIYWPPSRWASFR